MGCSEPSGEKVRAPEGDPSAAIVGRSAEMRHALALARRFAPSGLPVLLVGPTGTGKELFARAIHAWSGVRGPLVDVNCGAVPASLFEGEFFGHRRGAFTGATEARHGLALAADGGTLFLDELASLPAAAQAALLRALETGEVRPLGDTRKQPFRARLIAAAPETLASLLESGRFRQDLFHRIAGVVIRLSALADRPEDLLPLAVHFAHRAHRVLAVGAEDLITRYSWPGNVRELQAAVQRACVLTEGESAITSEAMRHAISLGEVLGSRARPASAEAGRFAFLREKLAEGWSAEQIAVEAGVHRATVFRWMRTLDGALESESPARGCRT